MEVNKHDKSIQARPARTGWVPGSILQLPTEFYKQRRALAGTGDDSNPVQDALNKRECVMFVRLHHNRTFPVLSTSICYVLKSNSWPI